MPFSYEEFRLRMRPYSLCYNERTRCASGDIPWSSISLVSWFGLSLNFTEGGCPSFQSYFFTLMLYNQKQFHCLVFLLLQWPHLYLVFHTTHNPAQRWPNSGKYCLLMPTTHLLTPFVAKVHILLLSLLRLRQSPSRWIVKANSGTVAGTIMKTFFEASPLEESPLFRSKGAFFP